MIIATSDNRERKAKKIEAVVCDFLNVAKIERRRILDLGCGSGHIAEYFSRANDVVAADVVDRITLAKGGSFTFKKIDGDRLPFADGAFDIVLLNHVISCMADQRGQMREIRRVLKEDGVCYFASPNRNFPIEGFTKIPLLHYLPAGLFRRLYKKMKNTDYDLFLLSHQEMITLITGSGFSYKEYTGTILRDPAKYNSEYTPLISIPNWFSPTNIFILTREHV